MFQRILIPLDGSTRAERAIPVAARLAHASGGSVTLVRVVSKFSSVWPSVVERTTLARQVLAADLAEAEHSLAGVATLPELEGVPTESVVRFGPTVSTILAVADASQADLIVLCSHSDTGITRRIMGNVAEKLARAASMPVLVLREDGPVPSESLPGTTHPLRALVPLDGSAHAKAVLEPAAYLIAALAGPAPGVLHLVRVVQPVTVNNEQGGMLTASAKARRYLSATVDHIREGFVAPAITKLNLDVTWSVAVDTYVAETLIRTAENAEATERDEVLSDCDLIALATHGRDGLQRWVMGSVTEHVLRDTKLPLLVVPSGVQRMPARKEQTEEEDMGIREQDTSDVFSSVR
ncbi:MAG: universal stress protein [Chloroflexota bacterium]|nr:universal stress protein [Chloroflexota bacterium]